eukprot:534366_1
MVGLERETAGGGRDDEYRPAPSTPKPVVENRSEIRVIESGSGAVYLGEYGDGEMVIEWSKRACGDTSPAERGVVESLLSLPGRGKVHGFDCMKKKCVARRGDGDAGDDDVLPCGVSLAHAVEMEAVNGEGISLRSGIVAENGGGGGGDEKTEVKKEEINSVMNAIKDDNDVAATATSDTIEEVVEEDNKEEEEDGDNSMKEGGKRRVAAPWTAEEDDLLASLVSGFVYSKRWACLSRKMPSRNGKQCRERWNNHLDPGVKTGPFSIEEDCLIVKLQAKFGNKWAKIKASMPKRGDNSIKNRWNSSLKKKVEKLRQEYRKHSNLTKNPSLQLEVVQTVLESEGVPSDVAKTSAERMYLEHLEFQELKRQRVYLMSQRSRTCLPSQRNRQENGNNVSRDLANTISSRVRYSPSTPKRKRLSSGVGSDRHSDNLLQLTASGVKSQLCITPCKGVGGGVSDAPTEGFTSPETTPGSVDSHCHSQSDRSDWSSLKRKSTLFPDGDESGLSTITPPSRQRRKNASSLSIMSLEKDVNSADDFAGCGLSALEAASILSLSLLRGGQTAA